MVAVNALTGAAPGALGSLSVDGMTQLAGEKMIGTPPTGGHKPTGPIDASLHSEVMMGRSTV